MTRRDFLPVLAAPLVALVPRVPERKPGMFQFETRNGFIQKTLECGTCIDLPVSWLVLSYTSFDGTVRREEHFLNDDGTWTART